MPPCATTSMGLPWTHPLLGHTQIGCLKSSCIVGDGRADHLDALENHPEGFIGEPPGKGKRNVPKIWKRRKLWCHSGAYLIKKLRLFLVFSCWGVSKVFWRWGSNLTHLETRRNSLRNFRNASKCGRGENDWANPRLVQNSWVYFSIALIFWKALSQIPNSPWWWS